jgi:hypothetical protein
MVVSLLVPCTSHAEINYLLVKGVHELLKPQYRNFASPVYGLVSLKTKKIENIRFHGNLGPETKTFPCHYQVSKRSRDCPQDWTTAFVQSLFPSPDGHNFAANQGTVHDPISRLPPALIGQILAHIQEVSPRKLKSDTEYFFQVRKELIDLVYPENESNLTISHLHPDLQKKKGPHQISKIYESQVESRSNCRNPEEFLTGFHEINSLVQSLVLPDTGKKPNPNNQSLAQKRKETENFVNSLLGTLIESLNDPSPYSKHVVGHALSAYFWKKNNSREAFLELFQKVPHLLQDKFQFLLEEDSKLDDEKRTAKHEWLGDRFTKEDYVRLREHTLDAKWLVADPEILAFLAQSYENYESFYPPQIDYSVAAHSSLGLNKEKTGFLKHSNCGETSLQVLFNFFLYHRKPLNDPTDNIYDVDFLNQVIERHQLRPRKVEGRPEKGIVSFYTRNPEVDKSFLDEVHDDWDENVVSDLNSGHLPSDSKKINYLKPAGKTHGQVCEIGKGLDNMLNVIERVLGDTEEKNSLGRLNSRKARLDRLCELFSNEDRQVEWRARRTDGSTLGKLDKDFDAAQDTGLAVTFVLKERHKFPLQGRSEIEMVVPRQLKWDFQERHFSLKLKRDPNESWRRHVAPGVIHELLSKSLVTNDDADLAFLGWFIHGDKRPLTAALERHSEEAQRARLVTLSLYSINFDSPEVVAYAIDQVLKHQLKDFYGQAARWLRNIPRRYFRQKPIMKSLVESMGNSGTEPLIRAALSELHFAPLLAVEQKEPKLVQILTELGKWTPETVLEEFRGRTPLSVAVEQGNVDLARSLIHTASLSEEQALRKNGAEGTTILDKALIQLDLPMIEMILTQFPDSATRKNKYGETPAYVAVWKGHLDLLRLLMKFGAVSPKQLAQKNSYGNTPLHDLFSFAFAQLQMKAYQLKRPEPASPQAMIEALIESGNLKPEHLLAQNGYGDTPLHLAARFGYTTEIETLLKLAGPSQEIVSMENKDRKTPFQFANPSGKSILLKYMLPDQIRRELKYVGKDKATEALLLKALQKI